MQSAGRGSTSPGLELPSVRLADPDRAVLRAGLVGPDRAGLPLALGAGAAVFVDVPRRGQARTPLHTLLRAGQSPKARLTIVQLLVVPTELRKNLQTVSKDCSEVAAIGRRELIERPEQFTTPSYSAQGRIKRLEPISTWMAARARSPGRAGRLALTRAR